MHHNSLFSKGIDLYRRVFSLHEIETNRTLQWLYGAMLLFFFNTFHWWQYLPETTVELVRRGGAVCWPYFQSCTKLYFLHSMPYGYSQMGFYMLLFALMALAVYAIWRKWWTLAHTIMLLFFLWKAFVVFVLSYSISGVYDYYHLILVAVLLFLPHKEYFAKISFILLYFLAVTTKFHETWILGTYFTSETLGLPIFPNAIAPLVTNSVIGMQIVGSWFLLSRRPLYQRLALLYFATFHLYSGILVLYHYPTVALTALLVLFGPLYTYTPAPQTKRSLAGWFFVLLLVAFQVPAFLIPGDQKLTLEGNKFGMYMFEANHQCVAVTATYTKTNAVVVPSSASSTPGTACAGYTCITATRTYRDGEYKVVEQRWESPVAWQRCDPYTFFTKFKNRCANPGVARVSLVFDHSIDGGPFYRIVDQQNICDLEYKPFVHNDWILLPPQAPIDGWPVQNSFRYAN